MAARSLLIGALALAVLQCPAHSAHPGEKMLYGFINAALRLMTPESDVRGIEHTTWQFIEAKRSFLDGRFDPDANRFFKVIPQLIDTFGPGVEFIGRGQCFDSMVILTYRNEDDSVAVLFSLGDRLSFFCSETFVVSTGAETRIVNFDTEGEHEVVLASQMTAGTDANRWDLYERGPRVFYWPMPVTEAIANLAATAALFQPILTEPVDPYFAELNLEFLRNYVGVNMTPRADPPPILELDKSLIVSGDTFDIMRLDGLDPMISWAQGATTGHTVIAMWRDDQLLLCESNAVSAYWPSNGINCTPYDDWMEQGRKNDYNVVWAPLDRQLAGAFDVDAAWRYIDGMYGIDYGWEVVLTSLLDLAEGNVVCADSAGDMCIRADHWEMAFHLVEKFSDDAARVFKPAMMQRAGVAFDLPMIEAYYAAHSQQGIAPRELHNVVEANGWLYNTTRDGVPELSPVAICNVFTCNVWKAGGLFGDLAEDINCGEWRVNDNYRLRFYEADFERPEACVAADPENPLCQVLGKFTLRIDLEPGVGPRYNYADLHANFADYCPSIAPDYINPPGC